MAISLFHRVLRFLSAKSHDTLDKLEDPGSTGRQMIRDLQGQIASCEAATAAVIAEQTLTQKHLNDHTALAKSWAEKADAAIGASREDLATKALDQAEREQKQVAIFTRTLSTLKPRVDGLNAKLAELRQMKRDADTQVDLLDARAKAAHATKAAAQALGAVGDTSLDFGGLRDQVDRMEAEAGAYEQLAHDKYDQPIDVEFAEISVKSPQARLEALRAQQQPRALPFEG